MTVREFLTAINTKEGYGTDDNSLVDWLLDADPIWKSRDIDKHRWYNLQTVVSEVEGKLIKYNDVQITGDNSLFDMGLVPGILDDAYFVERKERQVTEVYYDSIG